MLGICRNFSGSDLKIDGRVLEERSLGMSVSSTSPSWLAGNAIRGGSRHLTRMAYEEDVHEFFVHMTEIPGTDYGLGNCCCSRLSIVSGITDFSGIIYYLPLKDGSVWQASPLGEGDSNHCSWLDV